MKVRLWKVIAGVLFLALLVGGGAMLYRAGYTHGVMSDVAVEALPGVEGGPAYMQHPYYGAYGYHGPMGFFFLGRFFFGMLFFFLFFGMIFRFFGMRRHWAMHRMGYPGKGGPPWMHHRGQHPCWGENPDDEKKEEESEE